MDRMYEWKASERTRMAASKKKKKSGDNSDEDEPEPKKPRPMLGESDDAKRVSRKSNHIYFYAGVSKASVYEMNKYIIEINDEYDSMKRNNPHVSMEPKPILLHINSFGGSVFAGFAAVDFIKQSKIPVHTIVEGASASCGTIMSVVGKKRYIRPTASMLIHQLSSWFGGKMTEIDDDYKNLEQMMDTIKKIYRDHTKMSDDQMNEFLKHDVWWMSEKCLSLGLVDEIWTGQDE
jgi:ATP-dependent Clp endopeptidase proteolytic subunit ClpP